MLELSSVDQLSDYGYICITYSYRLSSDFSSEQWAKFSAKLRESMLETVKHHFPWASLAIRHCDTKGCYLDGDLPPLFLVVESLDNQRPPQPLGEWQPPECALQWDDVEPQVVSKQAIRALVVTLARLPSGFSVTVRMPHSFADAGSIAYFVNHWSSVHNASDPANKGVQCDGGVQSTEPFMVHNRSLLRVQADAGENYEAPVAQRTFTPTSIFNCDEIRSMAALRPSPHTLRMKLTKEAVGEMKKQCGNTRAYTSNDAICAFLLLEVATQLKKCNIDDPITLFFPADLRGRFPGVNSRYFGNAFALCCLPSLSPLQILEHALSSSISSESSSCASDIPAAATGATATIPAPSIINTACNNNKSQIQNSNSNSGFPCDNNGPSKPTARLAFAADLVAAAKESGLSHNSVSNLLQWEAARQHRPKGVFLPEGRHVLVTNWSRFPLYDADFGFGPPVQVA
eukprot:CAMPEP_0181332734 /NCGR_PEP_ID=MMETSP1101-20121128/25274_1 /TAXON_ID=46948 /ORGANISM="Rhodomonas abbreviata, Strain Caron Lab Isolate" /LENGTH=457 /DNA_ID=CAMNT_0023442443 /DNA_START=102 /DNA_END=1472 /DNA_ORIENTATION=+